jgi:putative MATE family efflux protein
MSGKQGDFSQGKVSSLILRLGLPIVLAELVHVLYNIVDRMYIGHMGDTGTAALTGLGVCFPLITLIGAFANLCSTGGATLSTIARGEGDDARAERILSTAFTFLLLVGGFLTVTLFATAPLTLKVLGGDEVSLPYALDYFRIYVVGTIPVLISLGMNAFINSQGFPRIGMVTVILGAALNIVLDPLFIYALDMGVRGAALATVLSQSASAFWVLRFLCGKRPPVRLRRLRLDLPLLRSVMALGVTGFTFKITNSITQAIVNMVLKAWGGPLSSLYIGAMSLIYSMREIMSLPINGVTSGGQSVMSYNYGAKQYRRVSEGIRFVLLGGLVINTFMWVLAMFFPRWLVGIFTEDEALIQLTVRCARIYFGAFPFMALQVTGQHTFVALNYPAHALCFSLLRKIVLVAPLTLLLPPLGLGVQGAFWAEFISQVCGASACFFTMYRVIWRRLRRAEPVPEPAPALD